MCLVNFALLTGNIGKAGCGVNPLRGQNNVQGSAHMGCDPGSLTGSVSLSDGREVFSKIWQADVPKQKGLNLLEMMDAADTGKFKGLWAIGYDVLLTNPNTPATKRSLKGLELVIVQDLFLNETAKEFGSVFLPVCSSFEKDGTFMNAERRIQRIRKVMEPVGGSKPDWEIICDVARAMGMGKFFNFSSAEEIWNEVRSVWKAGAGISYARLERGGLQWPCPTEDHPGTEILHTESFPGGSRARFRPIEYVATSEAPDEEYSFTLITGRTLYQFNAGTMTMRTSNAALRPHDLLDISSGDARRLGLSDGQRVRIRSRYGEAILPIHIEDAMRAGELFATFHTPEVFLNCVTGPHRDRQVDTPEYKVTAVQLEKI
jgi:formate dehydrogenase major subunit